MGNQCQNGIQGHNYYNNNRFQDDRLAYRYSNGDESGDCYSGSSRSSIAHLIRQGSRLSSIRVLGQKTPDITEHYDLGRQLGKGRFGTTYLCTEISTGCQYACKSILKATFKYMQDIEDVRREIEIMHHLSGQRNIVTIKGAYEDEEAVHIVMELCAGGELFDRIQKGVYSEPKAAELIRTIIGIVAKCHSLGVMHRDLKPENFMLLDEDDDLSIKVIDFGLSVPFKPGDVFSELVGSPYYIAPEVVQKHYGPEADVWAAGVMLYVLLSGVPPFWAETEKRILDKVQEAHLDFDSSHWHMISDSAKDLIRKMLHPCPSQRLKAHEVLKHPWICYNGMATNHQEPTVLSDHKKPPVVNKLKKLTLLADNDNSTAVNLEEFIAATVTLDAMEHEQHLMAGFKYFDKDLSGYITVDNLQKACMESNTKAILPEDIVSETNQNNDGQIECAEFVTTMQTNSTILGWQTMESGMNLILPCRSLPKFTDVPAA